MVSIVVPLFNEEECIEIFSTELIKVLEKLHKTYEIIFIDDGSTDSSIFLLKAIASKNNKIRIFSFRKNQGKAEALSFGFAKATGDYIITLDADLQDRPMEIPRMLQKAEEGWDLVCGWRKNRKDSVLKIISSKIFNGIVGIFFGLRMHDFNCGLKIFTNDAVKSIRLYGGLYRFIPLLVHQQGFRVCEIAVSHDKRKFGKSKYGLSKVWTEFPDLFTMLFLQRYATRAFHFFGTIGSILFFLGLIILGYLSIIHFQGETIGRRPLLFFGMLLVISGFQVFFTGFLADLIINISYNQKAQNNKKELFLLKYTNDSHT